MLWFHGLLLLYEKCGYELKTIACCDASWRREATENRSQWQPPHQGFLPASTKNLLDVVAMVVVHFGFGEAAVPVRLVRLEVFNVGEAVVQVFVLMICFVGFVIVAVQSINRFWFQSMLEFVFDNVDGRRIRSSGGWTDG